MATGHEICPPERSESPASVWICRQAGILPSQYTSKAVDKLVSSITSTLKAIETSSPCSQGVGGHTEFLHEICTLCLPILSDPRVLSIVEQLICSQRHCSSLSHDFLAEVTSLQKGDGGYAAEPKLRLSYEARVKLWTLYLPSFQQEMIDLLKAISAMEWKEESELDVIVRARNVPRACVHHHRLFLYAEEVLKVLYISANTGTKAKQLVNTFNRQMYEVYKVHILEKNSRPPHYPQFNTDKWIPQSMKPEQ